MPIRDPYDRDKIIEKCADHTLVDPKKAEDWRKQGITTAPELRKTIAEVLEHPDTRVFRCEPKQNRGHPVLGEQFGREIYVLQKFNVERNRVENFVVALNPNVRDGEMIGGSSWVTKRDALRSLVGQEARETGREPKDIEVLRGGRPALREQESHRQVVEYQQPSKRPDSTTEAVTPKQEPSHSQAVSPAISQPSSATSTIEDLATSYAKAKPNAGISAERHYEAAYFAYSVDDPKKYPPRNTEMKERVEQRRFEERFQKGFRRGSGLAPLKENTQKLMQERMESYMDRQKQYTM